ncbi:hypothetical protein PoB_004818600 [Plakobranchus ocellatus]|uniref:Uncharacterized protein n=1 Tax=Plakobranchus ocellatus TaxID=259542 RepID=A0AAV4BMI5_9GAST|nr:hypothetical protein PoB_004818600 [Plakobranchus ocellatus]
MQLSWASVLMSDMKILVSFSSSSTVIRNSQSVQDIKVTSGFKIKLFLVLHLGRLSPCTVLEYNNKKDLIRLRRAFLAEKAQQRGQELQLAREKQEAELQLLRKRQDFELRLGQEEGQQRQEDPQCSSLLSQYKFVSNIPFLKDLHITYQCNTSSAQRKAIVFAVYLYLFF